MPHSPAETDPRPSEIEEPAGEASADGEGEAFGAKEPTRFAADVAYCGTARDHEYEVRVRHRLLDTSATVVIDGVEHDPKAEEKALKAAEKHRAASTEQAVAGEEASAQEPTATAQEPTATPQEPGADQDAPDDGLRFRCEEGFASLRITVLRPDADGVHGDAELIWVRTAGLGGVGEVEVRRGVSRTVLAPEDGSPSAAREEKRTEHPTRYALVAALTKSLRYLIPLLGFGALFSGLLDPVEAWVEERVRPAVEAVAAFLAPIREWLSELTRPAREFLSALLRPVAELWAWLMDVLFGWIPDLSLPFSIPDWVVDVALPLLLVVLVFTTTFRELRARREKLTAARAAADVGDTDVADDTDGADGDSDNGTADDGADGTDDDTDDTDGAAGDADDGRTGGVTDDGIDVGAERPTG